MHGAKREAQAQLNRLLVEVGDGAHQGTDATVGELLERWLAVASPDWSPKTVLETRRFLDRLVLPGFGATPLRKLTTASLDQFYADLRRSGGVGGKPLAPASVRRVHDVVRRGLQQGVKWGWLSANPAANATLPRVPRVDIQPPAPDQVATLIRMAASDAVPDPGLSMARGSPATLRLHRVARAALRPLRRPRATYRDRSGWPGSWDFSEEPVFRLIEPRVMRVRWDPI